MRKTKEEILAPYYKQNHNALEEWIDYVDALNAMDEYAKQVCIEYAKWVGMTCPEVSVENFLELPEQQQQSKQP